MVLWQNEIHGVTYEPAGGDIYITGEFEGVNVDFTGVNGSPSVFKSSQSGTEDFFLAKYNSNGILVWVVVSSCSADALAIDVDADANGVYITGWYSEGVLNVADVNNTISSLANGNDNRDAFIFAIDVNGVHKWMRRISGSDNISERGRGVCVHGNHVFLTGEIESNVTFYDPVKGNQNLNAYDINDNTIFISSYNQNNGGLNWIERIGNNNNQKVRAIEAFGSDVFIGGGLNDNSGAVNFPGNYVVNFSGGGVEFFTASIDTGTQITNWVNVEPNSGTTLEGISSSLAIDPTGYLIIGGVISGTTNFGNGTQNVTSAGSYDGVISINDLNTGNFIDYAVVSSTDYTDIKGVGYSTTGIFVCGEHNDLINLGSISLSDDTNRNGYSAKLGSGCVINPSIVCQPDQNVMANTFCQYVMQDFVNSATASSNCGGTLTRSQFPAVGAILPPGDTSVTIYVEDVSGNIDSCSFLLSVLTSVNSKIVTCGGTYLNESTLGAGNNGNGFSCVNFNTPGEDQYYQIDVPSGNHIIKVTIENVSSTTDNFMQLFWIGSGCPGSSCLESTFYDIGNQEFQNGANFDTYEAVGPGTYYLVVDAAISGINTYDISFDCIQSGVGFDESCSGDIDSDGVISTLNGSSNLTMKPCDNVTVCQELILENPGAEWLDSLIMDLGPCYTNVNTLDPSGNNSGFYNTSGTWSATYDQPTNTGTWSFVNSNNITWGDGNILAYNCKTYDSFCFNADISSSCPDSSGLDITLTIYDDGIGNALSTATSVDILHNNTFKLDDTAPIFSNCPSNIVVPVTPGSCSAIVSWVSPTVSDECPNPLIVQTGPASGSSFALGTTIVEYTATDDAGNMSQCSFMITVEDQISPVVVCAGNQTGYLDSMCVYSIPSFINTVSATDNCTNQSDIIYTQSLLPGTIISKDTIITISAIDASGNLGSCNFNLILLDTISPSITCPVNQVINVNSACEAIVPNYSALLLANDNCSPVSYTQSPIAGSIVQPGIENIVITATDTSGNSSSCQFSLSVEDTTAPVITCPTTQIGYVDGNCNFTIQNYFGLGTFSDNCPNVITTQSPTAGTVVSVGSTNIQLQASDQSGNTSSCVVSLTVLDTIKPVFTSCPNNITSCSNIVSWTVPTAADNCGSVNITANSSLTPGSIFPVGVTNISYTATDASGNIETCMFTVTVLPTVNANFSLPDTICLPQGSYDLSASITLNPGESSLFYSSDLQVVINGSLLDPVSTGSGLFEITHIVSNGVCADSIIKAVEILPMYTAQFTSPDTVCEADVMIDLSTFLSSGINNGFWSGNNVVDTVWTLTGSSGTNIISYTTGFGICADTSMQTIEVLPGVSASWEGGDTICNTNPVIDLNARILGTIGGVFTGSGVNSSTGLFDPSLAILGQNIITYSVGTAPCVVISQDTIFVLAEPFAQAGIDLEVCGDSVMLNAANMGIQGFWQTTSGATLNNPLLENTIAKVMSEGTYTFTWVVNNGVCSAMDEVDITFYNQPTIIDAGLDQTLEGQTETFLEAQLPDFGVGTWSSPENLFFADPLNHMTSVNQLQMGVNYVIWTVINGVCLPLSDTVIIVAKDWVIPSGFSPNGDTENEFFEIVGIENSMASEVQVFNRWGNIVYTAAPYNNNWRGESMSGAPLPEDTYFYLITIDNQEYSGYVVIRRQ